MLTAGECSFDEQSKTALQAFAESSLRKYHPVVLDAVDKTLKQCLNQPSVNG